MTVNPGYGGQKFIPEMLVKIRKARKMIEDSNRFIDLEVDGGINFENVCEVISSGANIIVAGSLIFKNKSPKNTIKKMKKFLRSDCLNYISNLVIDFYQIAKILKSFYQFLVSLNCSLNFKSMKNIFLCFIPKNTRDYIKKRKL